MTQTETQIPPAALDEAAAARYVGLSRWTLQKWRAQRRGPAHAKLGARVRYRVADLDAWLAAQRVAPTAAKGE